MRTRCRVPRSHSILTVLALVALTRPVQADVVVQVPVDALLNGRPVSTLTGGVVVPWTVGLDQSDGFITNAANAFLKQLDPALPDDGAFPATANRPEITLHFSNSADAKSPQARIVSSIANFVVPMPAAKYSKVYLIVASSYGDCQLTLTLGYADASSSPQSLTLPDWGTGKPLPSNPPIFFNLIAGLHKWNQAGMSLDTPTHSITGVELSPDSGKQLSSIRLEKTSAAQTLAFWGATGVASSAPDSGGGAGGTAGMGGGAAGLGGAPASSGGSEAGGAGAGGAGLAAAAGSDAVGGAFAQPPTAGAPNLGGLGGATSGSAGASAIREPNLGTNGSCAVQGRGERSGRAMAWLLGLGLVRLRRTRRRGRRLS